MVYIGKKNQYSIGSTFYIHTHTYNLYHVGVDIFASENKKKTMCRCTDIKRKCQAHHVHGNTQHASRTRTPQKKTCSHK